MYRIHKCNTCKVAVVVAHLIWLHVCKFNNSMLSEWNLEGFMHSCMRFSITEVEPADPFSTTLMFASGIPYQSFLVGKLFLNPASCNLHLIRKK